MQIKSLTHMATQSIPIVDNLPDSIANINFVPTPSVADTKTGSLYVFTGN